MSKKIIVIISVVFFSSLFIAPHRVSAVCNIYNASGSGIEQESIDRCLTEQRRLDQQARDQQLLQQQNYSNSLEQNALRTLQLLEQQNTQPLKSNDQICNDKFGQNSKWDGTKNSTGGLNCGCKDGYVQSSSGTSCQIKQNQTKQKGALCNGNYWNACPVGDNFVCPSIGSAYCETPKTNDQTCQDSYGTNSNWDGTKNDQGGLNCGCKTSYQWDQEQTQCISIPKTETATSLISNAPVSKIETKVITHTVKKIPDVKTTQKETTENITNIVKPGPIILNKVVETNTTTVVKPKGFWAKLKGLFGF